MEHDRSPRGNADASSREINVNRVLIYGSTFRLRIPETSESSTCELKGSDARRKVLPWIALKYHTNAGLGPMDRRLRGKSRVADGMASSYFRDTHLNYRIDTGCQVGNHLLDSLQVVERHLKQLLGLSTRQCLPTGTSRKGCRFQVLSQVDQQVVEFSPSMFRNYRLPNVIFQAQGRGY